MLTRLLAALALGSCSAALAQPAAEKPAPVKPVDVVDLNEIVISAPKLSKSLLEAPLSATVTTGKTIDENGITAVKDAAFYAPNTFFNEFTARKLSNPKFRGISGSPMNPGVTTYYDGVPQFNGNSSSLMLLDVAQVDFVRGPQAALFGRNTVGGLINITSNRPSLNGWHGGLETTHGNYSLQDYRGSITGALIPDTLGFSFAGGYQSRDGYTKNTVTNSPIDDRDAWFGKTQFLWTPSKELEVRLILAGERANDGDYGLNDLGQLRNNPRRSARDLVGYTTRDVFMPTLQVIYHADSFDFTSTTGFVWWQTEDLTDLDYSLFPAGQPLDPLPGTYLTRLNNEEQTTWTQEFRFSNPKDKPVILSESATLEWQAGLFLFYQDYSQSTIQSRRELTAAGGFFGINAGNFTGTSSGLRDMGAGLYLQGTLNLWEKLHLTAGVRYDYEDKEADLATSTSSFSNALVPAAVPAAATTNQGLSRSFDQVTPQAAISYDITPDLITYFTFAGGFKAGGFNAGSPAGTETYAEERSWNYEFGFKGRALDNSLRYGLALFYTDWRDLQLNVANGGPATFHIANAGSASARGIEIDMSYAPTSNWSIFGSAGWTDTRFNAGARDNVGGASTPLGGRQIPYTPDYTAALGTQVAWEVGGGYNVYARAEVQFMGSFNYDTSNTAGQDAYTIANFRLGVRNQHWFVEGFVNNALDAEYVPIAFGFPGIAPSGYVGESGTPLTFGVRTGIKF